MRKLLLTILIISGLPFSSYCQPKPGDWFREYSWKIPEIEGNEQFLRVGGNFDYQTNTPKFPPGEYNDGSILFARDLQLKDALKAEIMIEKVLCHDYTTGLAISVNGNSFLEFPEAEGIPEPHEAYMHHFFPVIEVPLNQLKQNDDNFFSLKVDSFQHWGWPQNLVYGLTLRIYYPAGKSDAMVQTASGKKTLDTLQNLILETKRPKEIRRVDFLAYYTGPDMDGDGIYTEWHHAWLKNEIRNHIGTSTTTLFTTEWNTSWIPDQREDIKLAARVYYSNGLIHFTQASKGYTLDRNYSIEFCAPYNIPKLWLTRNGEHSSNFYMHGKPENVVELKIVWRSWSPGYMNGLYLNDHLFFIREGHHYSYDEHEISFNEPGILNPGRNSLKTGKTPRYNRNMVHGMEVQYPGPMVLIRYKEEK